MGYKYKRIICPSCGEDVTKHLLEKGLTYSFPLLCSLCGEKIKEWSDSS